MDKTMETKDVINREYMQKNEIVLFKGDCLEVMKNIADDSVDFILCDLPYGVTRNKWDIIIPFEELWKQYNRVIKKMAQLYYLAASLSQHYSFLVT